MDRLHDVSCLFGGAFLANAVPHFVSDMMGQPFQSPFAKPSGKGLSSSTVNELWGFANFVIADNLASHKSPVAEKAIRERGAWILFLPSYSPDLNPIEKAFSKLKAHKRAARGVTQILIDTSDQTGVYWDQAGHPMLGSALVRDPKFEDRVAAEARVLLSTIPT